MDNVYQNLKSMEKVAEAKMTVGSHDLLAVTEQLKEKDNSEIYKKIKNLQGVKDLTSIQGIRDEFLKNVAK